MRWTCDPGCVFWLPPDHASMPAPIEWEPCPAYAPHECRQMRTPWSDGDGSPLAPDVGFNVDADGVVRMMVGRNARNGSGDPNSYNEWLLGEIDGELEFAIRWESPSSCGAVMRDLNMDVFAVSLHGPNDDHVDALLLGYVGSLEPVMPYRDVEPGSSGWFVGPEWVIQLDYGSKLTAYTHDFSSSFAFYGAHMNPDFTEFTGQPLIFGREALFQTANYVTASIWAYDDELGTHPLISYPGDTTQGAANIGSDGVDMVWTHGEGKGANDFGLYPTVSIMTAPYTTDPALLQPRRLRSDMNPGIGTKSLQFAVGCGYAGRVLADSPGAEIVRLSDGAAWVLEGSSDWRWGEVLGITCEDIFIQANDVPAKKPANILRVPLASLGEPLAPD